MLFLILCTYISLYYIRPFDWIEVIRGEHVFQVIGIISIVALLLAWFSGKIRLFRYKTDVMMAGFTFAIILSHVSHLWFGGAFNSTRLFLPSFVGYFLAAHALDSTKKIHYFILLLIGLTTFLAFEAFLQSTLGHASGNLAPIVDTNLNKDGILIYIHRAIWYGTFNDPNDLGLAMVIPIPFLIDRLLNRKFLVALLCLPLLLYGLYLTNSRGAMLALMISIFIYSVLRFQSTKGIALGLALAALIVLYGPSRVSKITTDDGSSQGRVESWYEGFQMFKSNPLFGTGQGTYTEYSDRAAHNSYVLVLGEEGVVGSFFFIGLFFYPLRWAKTNLLKKAGPPEKETERCLLSAATGSLMGLMTAMFFLSRSYILIPFLMIAILTALINCPAIEGTTVFEKDRISDRFHWKILTGVVVAEIVLLNLIVKVYV